MLNQNTHINNIKKYPIWLLPEKSDGAVPMCIPLSKPKSGNFIMEIWKDIKGFEGFYQISNYGRVRSLTRKSNPYIDGRQHTCNGIILKGGIIKTGKGYLGHVFYKNGKIKNIYTHRLVAEYFVPNPLDKKTVNHKDANPQNNHYTNLEWCTQKENIQHAVRNGLHPFGEKNGLSKLNELQVRVIRNCDLKQRELAVIFNVNQTTISYIRKRKTWKHIQGGCI